MASYSTVILDNNILQDSISIEQIIDNKLQQLGLSKHKSRRILIDGILITEGTVLSEILQPIDIADIQIITDKATLKEYNVTGNKQLIIINTTKALEEALQVVPRKDLKETAFFLPDLKTDKKGNLSLTFDGPEALTKWRLMLLAHNKKGNSGQLERIAITQKELSITPNYPRFFREKDTIVFVSKVSNLTQSRMSDYR